MFLVEAVEIKTAFSLIFKALFILFSWPGFNDGNNQDIFVSTFQFVKNTILAQLSTSKFIVQICFAAAISKISSRLETDVRSTSVLSLIKGCVNYFAQFQETVLHFDCALNLVNLIEVLNKHSEKSLDISKTLGKHIQYFNSRKGKENFLSEEPIFSGKMCWAFLSHHWYDCSGSEEKGPTFNKGIEYLLNTYFSCANHKIKAVELMCEWLKEEVPHLNNKDSSLTTLPNINK